MRVSLCVVAGSEPGFLRACLDAARPVCDEIIVVLTGSADSAAGPAHRAGARVLGPVRTGDLAEAHNLALDTARGEWVLALLDDEQLNAASLPLIQQAASAGAYDGYWFETRSYSYVPTLKWRLADATSPLSRGALGYGADRSVRLFRRRPGYRYRGPDQPSVTRSIRAQGGRLGPSGGLVHSYRLLKLERADLAVQERLQRRYVRARPDDATAWQELGALLLSRSRPLAAVGALRRACACGAGPAATFMMAEAFTDLEQPGRAVRSLRAMLRSIPRLRNVDFDRADVWTLLGIASAKAGQGRQAEQAYREALRLRRENPVALNNQAALLAERGARREAERTLRRLGPAYRGLAMPWTTLGTIRLEGGDLDGALAALGIALDINPQCVPARVNMAVAQHRAGREDLARRAGAAARELQGATLVHAAPPAPSRPFLRGARRGGAPRAATVVSVIPHLGGGGGRVLVDVVRALPDRPHVVVCRDADAYLGLGFRDELAAAGAELRTFRSTRELRAAIMSARARVVVHHWWPNGVLSTPLRCGGERWIAYGHSGRPLPGGHDAYVVVSAYHARFQGHLPPGRVRYIPNAVDCRRFGRPRRRHGPVTIAMVSRLDPGKFPRRLLDYLPPLSELGAQVVIAGRGRRRHEIEPDIHQRGLQDVVRFLGAIPSAAVPDFLAGADIGLHLNEAVEECGSVAVLEMMAAGLPVVSQPQGCVPELVVPGHNGCLASDAATIARHLRELILSPPLRRRMGARGRRRAARYDVPHFRRAVRRLIEDVLGGLPDGGPRNGAARGWQ